MGTPAGPSYAEVELLGAGELVVELLVDAGLLVVDDVVDGMVLDPPEHALTLAAPAIASSMATDRPRVRGMRTLPDRWRTGLLLDVERPR
ncbi:hypothetical protein [Allobranchiibius huperziae]|uniref:Uncharacterized protein n=1 Tax=Allobranchiibius huperziae TaxID=1874116 RepID=A0A853DER9_9MICO|nr:hypothetical protein [Allobranchiibius huperziae]NYJ75177.1 hypothetical protein [Allobranchiibius huperziae]